jgi:hypothetical protein
VRSSEVMKSQGIPRPMRPPKSAKNGLMKQYKPGFCVQKTNELINIEIDEKFKSKKYLNSHSSSDSYENI